MASKSFNLADAPDTGEKGPCAKFCVCACVLVLVGVLGVLAVYVYQTTYGSVCSAPELDENGLSNWTTGGADSIAYACFPGYFLEGESDLVVGKCEDGLWNPPTPACNSLPIRIDCQVNNQSITGNITMWQHSVDAPTHIYGRINYTLALKPQGHLMEYVIISKRTCNVSHVAPVNHTELEHHHPEPKKKQKGEDPEMEDENESSEDENEEPTKGKILKIKFNSTQLKAFKKTELFMNIIFVDEKTTATLVSVHQANLTLVMTSSDPIHSLNSSWSWDKEEKIRGLIFKRETSVISQSRM